MKILHTSDWHFGRRIHQADLTPAFELWGQHVIHTVDTHGVNAVLISGDVFDRAIAPQEMLVLFSEILGKLLERTQVVVTSGNHDSATRLGFLSQFTAPNLHIRTDPRSAHLPVHLYNAHGELGALCYPIPFLDPFDVDSWAIDYSERLAPRTQEGAMAVVLRRIASAIENDDTSNKTIPRIAMAHTFCIPAQKDRSPEGAAKDCASQSAIAGGVDAVPSHYFRLGAPDIGPLDYVALGHLHGMHKAGTNDDPDIRYSGSPIAFSFSEEDQVKGSLIIEFPERAACSTSSAEDFAAGDVPSIPHDSGDGGNLGANDDSSDSRIPHSVTFVPAPIFRPLKTLEGTLDDVLSPENERYADSFTRIYITDPSRPDHLFHRLEQKYRHLLHVEHLTSPIDAQAQLATLARQQPEDMILEFFTTMGGRELNDTEKELIHTAWKTVENGKGAQ
ncbi:MAG: exonuclease SbcCD subunit D [Actinomycetaceae bacterium]|nr:exonuclease SbcCD subunit D [Arcanobacterium sp.]MDD7505005.1 exonuclease SbcCD subunit D [Actinomycetaceae bacterium]MDY6143338.1 exonuclease SbcCD subunit D [Arcanobacterium sp.]